MPASPIRKLTPLADEAKKRGVHVYHLNIGQPDIETPPQFRDRLAQMNERVLAYTPSCGTASYLDALQGYYRGIGIELGRDQLIATTGGSEAILFTMFATTEPGDEILVVEPFYTNYTGFAMMAGASLVPLTSRGRDGFHLPPRDVWEKALTPKTKLVILCNPNNPTGTVYTREEVEMVASFCRDHGLFLLSDEVYREFVYDGLKAISALSLEGFEDVVIVADSLSKRFSSCGIRLGCLATRNADVYSACNRMAQVRLSAPGLAQSIAVGISEIPQSYYDKVNAEYAKRRDILYKGLSEIPGVFLEKPEGAFYCIARIPVRDSDDFASWLLSDFQSNGSTVMVAPGAGFYATPGLGRNEVRIAYVLEEKDLKAAIAIFREALQAYHEARESEACPEEVVSTELGRD